MFCILKTLRDIVVHQKKDNSTRMRSTLYSKLKGGSMVNDIDVVIIVNFFFVQLK